MPPAFVVVTQLVYSLCRRRWDREKVAVCGVPEVWGLSPSRPELE